MKNWLVQKIEILRWMLIPLFILALLGPWSFDRIHVPAQFACEPPNIRLYGDFCGMPFSGFQIAAWTTGGIFDIAFRQTSTLAGLQARGPELFAATAVLFVLGLAGLPLISTPLVNLHNRRRTQVVHLIALSLALLASLFALVFQFRSLRLAAWGISLAAISSGLALTLETLTLRIRRNQKPQPSPPPQNGETL